MRVAANPVPRDNPRRRMYRSLNTRIRYSASGKRDLGPESSRYRIYFSNTFQFQQSHVRPTDGGYTWGTCKVKWRGKFGSLIIEKLFFYLRIQLVNCDEGKEKDYFNKTILFTSDETKKTAIPKSVGIAALRSISRKFTWFRIPGRRRCPGQCRYWPAFCCIPLPSRKMFQRKWPRNPYRFFPWTRARHQRSSGRKLPENLLNSNPFQHLQRSEHCSCCFC